MSITIASLKYQETDKSLMRHIRNSFGWLGSVSVLSGVSGKATVNDIDITGTLLKTADCTLDVVDTELAAKEVELNYYNLSFPISHCDLRRTWLSAFADKYVNEEEVYIDALIPYLAEKIGDEFRTQYHTDIITEATADADVVKVTLTGGITTPALTYATVVEFIDGLPANFIKEALDEHSREWYDIQVSAEAYKLLAEYLGDKVVSYGLSIGGFNVVANKELSGKEMIAKTWRNDLLVIDDTEDIAKIKVVPRAWENKSYIVTGLAFKGSYKDSKRIVISN